MMFVSQAVANKIARRALTLEKASPQLLFGAGIVGVVGSTVLACRATLKLEEVLLDTKDKMEEVKEFRPDPEKGQEYSEKDRQRDITLLQVQGAVKVVRLYAPAIVLGGASVAALVQSHSILTKRNAALMAAYSAIEKGFAEYRQRVVDKYGVDEDRNFRYGTREVDIIEHDTGKKKTVTRVADDVPSVYARFFDNGSGSWSKDKEINLYFLACQQNYCNNLLLSRGHLFLNEVYDQLGLDRSRAGSIVGWIIEPNSESDNYVDFGVWDDNQNARDFVNGREGSILLDFNVNGVIFDKIDTPTEAISWQRGN
jgi:hypothetical protein